MTALVVVSHMPVAGGAIRILGVYACEEDAHAAVERAKPVFGPEDLYWLDEYDIGKDDWPSASK